MKLRTIWVGVGVYFLCISAAKPISITVQPAKVVCAISVSGMATDGATAVTLFLVKDGYELLLQVNGPIYSDGSYRWRGLVPGVTSLKNAQIKAVTNRETTATAGVDGICSAP